MQSALVTGATSGIGRALARELRDRGVVVVATGRNREELRRIEEDGGLALEADLATQAGPRELFRAACEKLGRVPDFLVNNAGFNSRKAPIIETTDEELDALYAVNLRAPIALAREALAAFAPRGSGHILNVGSTVVHHGIEQMALYSAMKAGLTAFSRVLVKEARPYGVKVTVAHPGGTDSGFRAQARPDYMAAASVARVLADCLFSPEDVVMHELTFRPLVETNF